MASKLMVGGVLSAAALAGALAIGPAQADSKLSSSDLTAVVPRTSDVKAFFKNSSTSQAPIAGTGQNYIPVQGICEKANKKAATLNNLSKRQAWSSSTIGGGETRGIISIVGQYKSAQQAKNKLNKVMDLLKSCPATVHDGGAVLSQDHLSLPTVHKGKAVATFTGTADPNNPDAVQYVAIRQTGALLSFVRFSQLFEGKPPNGTQYMGMVDNLSIEIANDYHALAH